MLYKYIGDDDARNVLKNLKRFMEDGTISSTQPVKFNDPSEFKVSIRVFGTPKQLRDCYDKFEGVKFSYNQWLSTVPAVTKEMEEALRSSAMKQFGVICLASVSDSILMWSHYSASHKGFCIGFDDEFIKTVEDFHDFDYIKYIGSAPVFNYALEDIHALFQKVFFYKDSCWHYENERRIITKSHGVKKFDKKFIREIYLGHNVDLKVENYAKEMAEEYPAINFYKMSTKENSYQLIKKPLV
ncbi:TPA: DUF2971 domain-containing protein [Escherichia coli]|uniref:DUF2971 domain-containing protein n=2 Tax=Escherichia coli TaxID=562 RepID=UPI000B7D1898|nr:DUF2971 domain-containing protein [Escherichia coli]EEZ9826342.1 DUF2971 domain-containing protein [Escherichia coli O91]EEY5671187.1 DUF2971 domain-containing protein [Escherichia coli]EFC1777515.1 DUF2971 domain-containing protein [Escherichia coli]EFD0952970.1 DUF2971 domain-containing protein [Escherichia coli]EFE5824601.1 DUF2971 domain-containing protein [Escherichia coli]